MHQAVNNAWRFDIVCLGRLRIHSKANDGVSRAMQDAVLHARIRSMLIRQAAHVVQQLLQVVIYNLRAGNHSIAVAAFDAYGSSLGTGCGRLLVFQDVVDLCDPDLAVYRMSYFI